MFRYHLFFLERPTKNIRQSKRNLGIEKFSAIEGHKCNFMALSQPIHIVAKESCICYLRKQKQNTVLLLLEDFSNSPQRRCGCDCPIPHKVIATRRKLFPLILWDYVILLWFLSHQLPFGAKSIEALPLGCGAERMQSRLVQASEKE